MSRDCARFSSLSVGLFNFQFIFAFYARTFQIHLQWIRISTWFTRSYRVSELLVAKYSIHPNVVSIPSIVHALVMVSGQRHAILYMGNRAIDFCQKVRIKFNVIASTAFGHIYKHTQRPNVSVNTKSRPPNINSKFRLTF